MDSGDWRMEKEAWQTRRVHPALIVGVGVCGARIAAAFAGEVAERCGGLPIVRAVALLDEHTDVSSGVQTLPFPSEDREVIEEALAGELERIRALDAVRAARQAGWTLAGGTVTGVVTLVASLVDDGVVEAVLQTARSLKALSERGLVHRFALSAVLLVPREGTGEKASSGQERLLLAADDLYLFDGGCYLLDQVNANGLLLTDDGEQVKLVAHWLSLRALTDLSDILDQMPLAVLDREGGASFDTFGVSAWEFPLEPLKDHLARRWQAEVLQWLLAPSTGDRGSKAAFHQKGKRSDSSQCEGKRSDSSQCEGERNGSFLERHGWPSSPWPRDIALRFRIFEEDWSTPAFRLIHRLREAIDQDVEEEQKRLRGLIAGVERSMHDVGAELAAPLAEEVDRLLDDHGLRSTEVFLGALENEAHAQIARLEGEVERCFAHLEELDELADQMGKAIDDLAARFPPLRLRTALGLLLRPWRLLLLWLLYRKIVRRVGVYLAYRQSQWLLQAEAFEHQWQAAFHARLVRAVKENAASVAQLRARLEQLERQLRPDPASRRALVSHLWDAALPGDLIEHFYQKVVGDGRAKPTGLLAIYGPLSRWVREDCDVETLRLNIAEHAREQFAFLDWVRLDDLLARTHDGAKLRGYLLSLVDAAAPWWAWDESTLSAEERAGCRRVVLIGLPDAESSMLADLLPDRPHICFSTRDRHRMIVGQVVQGLPLR